MCFECEEYRLTVLLGKLSTWLSKQELGSFVLLVDEYDSPLTTSLNDNQLFTLIREDLSQFFSTIKSQDSAFRFIFITGITKFNKTSIFSAFNNLSDISLIPEYGDIVGYHHDEVKKYLAVCERIYFDILVDRLAIRLEHFNPNKFVTMYLVDAMDGFQFEDFLVEIFQTMGYDVKETKRTQDQGADLFVTRFGKDMVIQAKNYSGSVGNSAVQQVISAKTFYGCDEAMVVTNSYFTRSAKELAESALVRLIDRDELQKYLDDYNQKIIEDFQSNS